MTLSGLATGCVPSGLPEWRHFLSTMAAFSPDSFSPHHPLRSPPPPPSPDSISVLHCLGPVPLTWENVLRDLLGLYSTSVVTAVMADVDPARLDDSTREWLQAVLVPLSSLHTRQRSVGEGVEGEGVQGEAVYSPAVSVGVRVCRVRVCVWEGVQ